MAQLFAERANGLAMTRDGAGRESGRRVVGSIALLCRPEWSSNLSVNVQSPRNVDVPANADAADQARSKDYFTLVAAGL